MAGRTEMDGIAQSESYKRTSFCYLKERRWRRSCEGNGEGEGGSRTRVVVGQTMRRRNGGPRQKESKLFGGLPAGLGQERVKILDRVVGKKSRRDVERRGRGNGTDTSTRSREKLDSWE